MPERAVARRWMIAAPASLALGWLLTTWQVPAAWILAAILVAGAMALTTGEELPINETVYRFGRGIIGILAALPLVGVPLGLLAGFLIPGLLVTVVTLGVGIGGGLLLARAQASISRETGILSMLAGGASIMPILARELGADFRFVALSQYLRLLAVSVALPLVVVALPGTGNGAGQVAPAQVWWMVPLIAVLALAGQPIGRALHLPVPSVLAPLIFTVVISLLLPAHLHMTPPEALRILAFLTIGWVCGGALSLPALKAFARQLPATLAFVAVLMGACALTAWPLAMWLDITYFEAYLATSPGALETVLALSSEGGAGPAVVAIQLIRMLAVIAIAGYLPQLIRLLSR